MGLALAAGCTASADEVHPPENTLAFPTGLAVSPDESALFVANSNSELRYDSGSISVLDLVEVGARIEAWRAGNGGDCDPDLEHPETLVCDEAQFFKPGASVRIGNFATDIALQDFGAGRLRVFVPTRGDPSIAWADYDGNTLSCSARAEGFALCDDAHRLSSLYNDPDQARIVAEPFGVFADGPGGFAVVSHLVGSAVTLIKAPADSSQVQIIDVRTNLFLPDADLIASATGIVGRPRGAGASTDPGVIDDIIYVGSRTDRRVQTLTVGQLPTQEPAYLLPGNYFFLNQVGGSGGGVAGSSSDTRGMRFSPSGDRLYLVNREPPSLQLFDTSLDEGGFPRNLGAGAIEICRQGSTVEVFDNGGERAYVTCFQDGELHVVDPRDLSRPEDVLLVGRGPYAVVAAKGKKLLFVSNTLEDTIAVVDVDATHPATHNRVVLRIGTPRIP